MTRSLPLLAVAVFGLLVLCSAQAPDMTCALTADDVKKIDFSKVKAACVASAKGDALCDGCICSMSSAFGAALTAKGLNANLTSMSQADATNAIINCLDIVVPALTAAGETTLCLPPVLCLCWEGGALPVLYRSLHFHEIALPLPGGAGVDMDVVSNLGSECTTIPPCA